MKNLVLISALVFFSTYNIVAQSQNDSLGLPGDNLDLASVLGIFKESQTPEDFEKKLNAADTKINNLDLNHDGEVDYLRVIDNQKNGAHSIVIQDPISKSESQDVAVIEIEKKKDNTAHVQIVGDETLYGKNYIVEPKDVSKQTKVSSDDTKSYDDDVYSGSNNNVSNGPILNVYGWPSVSYLYGPGYVPWVSPWYWGFYPGWYYPWAPFAWYPYRTHLYGYNYYNYGRRSYVYHNPRAHRMYTGQRVSSGYVQKSIPRSSGRVGGVSRSSGVGNQPRINQGRQNNSGNMSRSGAQTVNNRGRVNRVPTQSQSRGWPAMNRGGGGGGHGGGGGGGWQGGGGGWHGGGGGGRR